MYPGSVPTRVADQEANGTQKEQQREMKSSK
jgi:hypothetical protein